MIVSTANRVIKINIGIKIVIMTNLMVSIDGSKNGTSNDIIKYNIIDKKARDNKMSANLKINKKIGNFLAFIA